MKKLILSLVSLCALGLAVTGCGKKELKQADVQVASVELKGDSLVAMRATDGADTLPLPAPMPS